MRQNKDDDKKIYDVSELMEVFGRFHITQYFLMCIPAVITAMVSINYIFTVLEVDYRCRIDECETANSTAQFPSWWPETSRDKCSMPMLKSGNDICTNNSFTDTVINCNSWIYENDDSVISELDLACQPWKSSLIGAIHNTGMMISTVFFGWVSDRIGRKPVFILCAMGGIVGVVKTFTKTYYVYASLEFLLAIITGGFYSVAFVIFLEITGKKYRVLSGVIFAYAIYLGEIIFASIALLVPNWKTLTYVLSAPSIFFLSLVFFIYESPRWQIINGKIEEAKTTMLYIANVNKINVDIEEIKNLDETKLKEKFKLGSNEVKESVLSAFKSKVIVQRLIVALAIRFTSNFVYYGLLINSIGLPGNKHVNFILSALMSFPGDILCLYFTSKFGRKMPLMIAYLTCGLLCIISAFTPAKIVWVKLSVFLIGKIIIAGCYTASITYSMELFPTSVRGSLVGLGFLASRIGGIVAPLTPILNTISDILPFLSFGCSAILSALLLLLTPETKTMPLFDTIQQVEKHAECARKNTKITWRHPIKKDSYNETIDAALHI